MRITISKRILVCVILLVGLASVSAVADSTNSAGSSQRFFEVRDFMRQANKTFERAKFDSASALYDSVLTIDPTNPDASYFKGKILAHQGDTVSALNLLAEAVAQNQRSARLKIYLARLYLAQTEIKQALDLCQLILDIKPNDAEALYIKGSALLQVGDSTQALDHLEKALKLKLDRDRGNGKK